MAGWQPYKSFTELFSNYHKISRISNKASKLQRAYNDHFGTVIAPGDIASCSWLFQEEGYWQPTTLRRRKSGIVRQCLQWKYQGKRRPRGRPRVSWQRTVVEEMKAAGLNWETLSGLAQNRVRWRCFVDGLCSGHGDFFQITYFWGNSFYSKPGAHANFPITPITKK